MTRNAVITKAARSSHAAEQLRAALDDLGIAADVHEGHGAALLSVWVELLVWSDGFRFMWWNGEYSARTGRRSMRRTRWTTRWRPLAESPPATPISARRTPRLH